MTASCGNFMRKRDKRVRQEHSDLYYCTKCFYFSLKCNKIVSSWLKPIQTPLGSLHP